eukprot:TRINITY_DN2617_c0_g1_i9.p1 TRINITY_DN2617_c0_g1~~TRINITY_DN2617_c0_g1_i9.p1  ORF type:complete len:145 (+),score=22.88 TRINITY_DN2617_c0_g1_i9:374-808(+)
MFCNFVNLFSFSFSEPSSVALIETLDPICSPSVVSTSPVETTVEMNLATVIIFPRNTSLMAPIETFNAIHSPSVVSTSPVEMDLAAAIIFPRQCRVQQDSETLINVQTMDAENSTRMIIKEANTGLSIRKNPIPYYKIRSIKKH